MKKKIILIAVMAMYLSCALASPIVLAENSSENSGNSGIFTSELSFDVSTQTNETISPGQTKEVQIKVKFRLVMSNFAYRFFSKRRIGRLMLFGPGYILKFRGQPQATVNLSITKPDWCTAQLDTSVLNFSFGNVYAENTVKLTFSINESAPALEQGDITISAEFDGYWTIKGATNSTTISVRPAYKPDIVIDAEKEFTVSPLQNTTIPINITNYGNGKTKVAVQVSIPENWTINLDQNEIALEINETKLLLLTVNPTEGFTNQTIDLTFTPKSAIDEEYEGSPVTLGINFLNKASKEEETNLDFIITLAIVIVVIIVLILSIVIFRKKKQ